MKTKKILVYTLILLLSISFISGLLTPAKAETTWTPITLPCTITESGNYAISGSWTGSGVGLNISTSNVVVDGQNCSISLPANSTGDYGVYMDSQSNVTLQNLNVICAQIGLQVNSSSTFTIQNCNITNGFIDGLSIANCTDFTVVDCNVAKSYNGIDLNCSNSFQIVDCNASANLWFGIVANASSEFGVYSCNASANAIDNGFYATNCDSFTVDSVDLNYNGWNGFSVYASSNYVIESSNCSYNGMAGVYTGYGNNSYVENCIIDGNGDVAIVVPHQSEGYYENNEIANNSQATLAYLSDSITFDNNNITNNGLTAGTFYGGIQATDSNCTVSRNNFDNNYDALLWEVTDSTSNNTFNVNGNVFQNNDYTFFFNYTLPNSNVNQKLYFYNNLVNDSALMDPTCLTVDYSGNYLPINSNAFNFNTTQQMGARIYSNGPFIGGNFWATPNGMGISQIGTDADQDGFVDTPFNLFDNASIASAYDYHPYSLNFDVNSWVNITLPVTIASPGHYRITAPYTGRGNALTIAANNVTVDGQNNLIQNLIHPLVESEITPQMPSRTGIVIVDSENLTLENLNIQGETYGINAMESSFTIRNINFSDCRDYGITADTCYNYSVQDCNFQGNSEGLGGESCVNATIARCYFNNNTIGIDMADCSNCTYINSMFNNCSIHALWDIYSANETISGNCFDHTGTPDSNDWDGTALFLGDVGCKVSNNIFLNNYNGFFWGISEPGLNFTQLIYNNQFIDNNNTMILCCFESNNCTNEKMYFYNNFVNDTNYVNPYSFSEYNSGPNLPFNSSILIFNMPLQTGTRVYSNGGMIGGNYWAHPNGTGPSQTGTDANHDGFIDTPFDLFGNSSIGTIYDYLPYSSGYTSNLTFLIGNTQTLVVNQTSTGITVQYTDFFGNLTTGTIVNLSSNSSLGKFYSDAAGTQQITSLTIPAGSSTATFFYKDLSAGNPVITASAQGVTNSATANFTINPHSSIINHITVSANATTIAAGDTASFTTIAYDVYGNAWNVSASYTVDGQAFSGTSLIGEIPGAYTVESTYNDKTDRATLIVTPGPVARFIVLAPNSATVGTPFNIRVVALDSLGNLVTGFTGTVALTANGTNLNPSTSGAFTQGQWFGTVTIAQAGSFKITATDSNGHSGISSVFTVSEAVTPTPGPTTTNTISATKDGSSTVNIAVNGNITASQYANVTITTNQTAQTTTVSFTVTGQTGTTGYGNITLPKSQIPYGTTLTVYIDGQPAENQSYTQDSQNYYVYYSTHFSTHNVEIRFNGEEAPGSESPLLMYAAIIAVIAVAIAIAAIAVSKRKHKPAKTPQ